MEEMRLWEGSRIILHGDLDAFFASVEIRDHPEFEGLPLVVGGIHGTEPHRGMHGVVSAASYAARTFGIRSGMSLSEAVDRCESLIVRPVAMGRYREVSREVFELFFQLTPAVEPTSVDEAFLDITGSCLRYGTPTEIARTLKDEVKSRLGVTLSVGIGPNKLVAKIASELGKPDGLVAVPPSRVPGVLAPLPVSVIPGIGPKATHALGKAGIRTVDDARQRTPADLERILGHAQGAYLCRAIVGADDREVEGPGEPKSISREETFFPPLASEADIDRHLDALATDVAKRLRAHAMAARGVGVVLRTKEFTTASRQRTLHTPTDDTAAIAEVSRVLARELWDGSPLRLLGVRTFQLQTEMQLSLFGEASHSPVDEVVDDLRRRFGDTSISRGLPEHDLLHDLDGNRRDTPDQRET